MYQFRENMPKTLSQLKKVTTRVVSVILLSVDLSSAPFNTENILLSPEIQFVFSNHLVVDTISPRAL
jgi:hypothetical protein